MDWIPNNHIDVLIITHQHYDHFDGIQTLIDNEVTVDELWECPYKRRYGDNSVGYDEWQDYQNLKQKLVNKGTKVYNQKADNVTFE